MGAPGGRCHSSSDAVVECRVGERLIEAFGPDGTCRADACAVGAAVRIVREEHDRWLTATGCLGMPGRSKAVEPVENILSYRADLGWIGCTPVVWNCGGVRSYTPPTVPTDSVTCSHLFRHLFLPWWAALFVDLFPSIVFDLFPTCSAHFGGVPNWLRRDRIAALSKVSLA
jgi:hypothetical protein